MKKETDLQKIKEYANRLLVTGIAKTSYSSAVVQHPFTNSGILCLKSRSGQTGLFDLTADRTALADWRKRLAVQINRAKSVMDIYAMLNKSYCLFFLNEIRQFLSSEDFSKLLADAWIRSEYPNDDPDMRQRQLLSLFRDAEPTALMSTDEYAVWANLPDTVTIYRGVTSYNASHVRRMSWTLDRKTAEWFAHRFGENGSVYQARIPKNFIYAFFHGRNEAEVIVNPEFLTDVTEAQTEDPVFEQPEKSSEQEDSMKMNVTATDYGAASEYDGTLCEKAGKQMDKNKVYELIEVCGRKALFTNEKLYNRDVPKGLYCYDVRTDDSGNFCTLEANVYVN